MSPRIPASILVALAIHAAFALFRLIVFLGSSRPTWMGEPWWGLAMSGVAVAGTVLFAAGAFELAKRLPGGQATGMKLAGIVQLVLCGMELCSGVLNYFEYSERMLLVWTIEGWAYNVLFVASAIGFAIGAGIRHVPGLAAAFLLLTFFTASPPPIAQAIHEALELKAYLVFTPVRIAFLALLFLLVREAARSATAEPPSGLVDALALAATGLRIRLVAMLVLVAFTVFALGGKSLGMMKLAMIGGPLVNVIAFLVFATGIVRAARHVEGFGAAIAMAAAAWASAWAAGVFAYQVPAFYGLLSDAERSSWMRERFQDTTQALSLALPLIASAGVVIALLAIAAHARRTGQTELAQKMAPRATTFVLLMLASVGVVTYLVPKVKSVGEYLMLAVVAAVCGIIALVVAANAFKEAARLAGWQPTTLPTATALPPDHTS